MMMRGGQPRSMSKLMLGLAAILGSVALVVGLVISQRAGSATPDAKIPSLANDVTTIYVIGDSYTGGSDEGGRGNESWPRVLNRELGDSYNVVDASAGQSGYTSKGPSGVTFVDMAKSLISPAGNLVVFFGSRTDAGQNFSPAAREAFRIARSTDPNAKILVVGPPWVSRQVPAGVLTLRDTLRSAALAEGALFFDPIEAGWFADRPDLIGRDRVHPTDEGHAYMAALFKKLFLTTLQKPES